MATVKQADIEKVVREILEKKEGLTAAEDNEDLSCMWPAQVLLPWRWILHPFVPPSWKEPMRAAIDGLLAKHHGRKDILNPEKLQETQQLWQRLTAEEVSVPVTTLPPAVGMTDTMTWRDFQQSKHYGAEKQRSFENSLSSYCGDDPLDPWDRFVEYLGKRVAPDAAAAMLFVLNRLVERFLHEERYANDVRYVNHCIRCASYYAEPVSMYAYVYGKGVGTRAAPLYVAWAQQFEQSGAQEQAEAVYQRAVENQAQPSDAVLHEYRYHNTLFLGLSTAISDENVQSPDSTARYVTGSLRVLGFEPNDYVSCICSDCATLAPADRMQRIISRSENLGVATRVPGQEASASVSVYQKDALQCEGSELSFEEVRAARYFLRVRQEEERREFEEEPQRLVREKEEEIMKLKRHLETLNQDLGGPQGTPAAAAPEPPSALPQVQHKPPTPPAVFSDQDAALAQPQPPAQGAEEGACAFEPLLAVRPAPRQSPAGSGGRPGEAVPPAPSARPGLPGFARAQGSRPDLPDGQRQVDVSQGATASFSHITPNTSLGLAQATPSRVLPSPTVNTREALGVIMDMFQAPTLLDDPFNNTSLGYAAAAAGNGCPDGDFMRNGKCTSSLANPAPTSATPFSIFQDHWDQENPRYDAPPRVEQGTSCKPGFRGFEGPQELTPDESTMWGVRYNSLNSLAACPNSSRDFALSAQVVSTPFTSKTPYFTDSTRQDRENNCQSVLDDEENVFLRQPKKLSPIIEQSPSDETFSKKAGGPMRVRGPTECGTIVGEGLSLGPHSGLAASCTTVVHAPPGALSFRDHTLVQSARSPPRAPGSAATAWSVFASPAPSPKPAPAPPLSQEPEAWVEEPMSRSAATAGMALQRPASPGPVFDVPMSPECGLNADWLVLHSPEVITEPDLDAFLTPPRPPGAALARGKNTDVSMTPDAHTRSFSDMCVSPAGRRITQSHVAAAEDEPMMSPERGSYPCAADVSMSPAVPKAAAAAGGHLVSDPWNEELIAGLLSRLSPSLGSHPHCITWQCKLPNITPKTTITMGTTSLRVDCLLGEGAFAKVYQATYPMSSEKTVVKVQKPANPWEFYINTQLDARLPPAVRHLYSKVQSAHLFHNGSILLAELHRCGTLLNAVNQYKKLSDRVMPQPLVMYFTVCMLHMVEQLHRVHLVHADIKPDNFLLGERFLESRCLDPEDTEHGMVLLDMGQSIDMELFPEGTAFTARCLTSGFQCTEMLSGRPWSYQTDYFGLAGSVYCMLFGTYMQVKQEDGVWKTNAVFRRNPHSELWLELFHTLLNIPDGDRLPCLRSLRRTLTAVLRETYGGGKLLSLKNRLVVLLLENLRDARR
ncbi:unnamed protein product [Merluccius merluccius]